MYSKSDATGRHDGIKGAMGDLVVAPIDLSKPGIRILDSGTGDAYWLRDLLVQHPEITNAELIGTDMTDANFPKDPPAFTSLQVQSITEPWPSDWHKSFDFVHQRLVLGGCGGYPYQEAIKSLIELVKPGGWIQLVEADQMIGLRDGPAMHDFQAMIDFVFECMGGNTRYAYGIKQTLLDAGMEEVEEYGIPHFLGAQIHDAELAARSSKSTASAMGPLLDFAKAKNATPIPQERMDNLKTRLEDELNQKGAYYPLRVIWGRVPV